MSKESNESVRNLEEAILNMVAVFCKNGGLKAVESHLLGIITSTHEWLNRCPKTEIAGRICALCDLYQFVQKLGEYMDEVVGLERETQNNPKNPVGYEKYNDIELSHYLKV